MYQIVGVVATPVASSELVDYREPATEAGKVWIHHGALAYFEGSATDSDPSDPPRTLAERAGANETETLVIAFIAFESSGHRDEVSAAERNDPAYQEYFGGALPFDPSCMATGSFEALVSLEG